jgi:hypothetical protein
MGQLQNDPNAPLALPDNDDGEPCQLARLPIVKIYRENLGSA